MFSGFVRKAILPLVSLVAIGWLLIIIGFGIEANRVGRSTGSYRYSWWMVILLIPIMLTVAVVQAAIDKSRCVTTIFAAIITFLSALFLTALGYLLNGYGVEIDFTNRAGLNAPASSIVQFTGSLIAGYFWVMLACLSHFYKIKDQPNQYHSPDPDTTELGEQLKEDI